MKKITVCLCVMMFCLNACLPASQQISGSWTLLYDYSGCDGWYDGKTVCTFIGSQFVCGTISGSVRFDGDALHLAFDNGSSYDGALQANGTFSGRMQNASGQTGCWVMDAMQ